MSTAAPATAEADDIVVTAPFDRDDAVRRRYWRAINRVVRESATGVAARWSRTDRLCVRVAGGTDTQQRYFRDAIVDAAALARLRVRADADADACDAAIEIILTPQSDRLLAGLRERGSTALTRLAPADWRRFAASGDAVRWVSFVEDRGALGEPPGEFPTGTGRSLKSFKATWASRLVTAHRSDIKAMLVVVDAERLPKMSNAELAAYLAMVALGGVRDAGAGPADIDSALNLFARTDPRHPYGGGGLTDWDRRYLHALYAGAGNVPIAAFRGGVLARLLADVKRADAASAASGPGAAIAPPP